MTKRLATTVIASIVLSNALVAAEPGPSKDVPELAALSNWAGAWNARIEKPMPRAGVSRGEWIHGGRYLKQMWKIPADGENEEISGTFMMTYDVKQKVYRQWQFNSDGFTAEATGKWDAETRTMTWTSRDPDNGNISVNKDRFTQAGVQYWNITVTDRNKSIVFEMSGQNRKRKK